MAATPAIAQQHCGERSAIVEHLSTKYGEQLIGVGLERRNAMVELYVSETGTYTVLVSFPNGRACLVVSGEHWQIRPLQPAGEAL
ncbi:hypothetical protein [Halovulum sp. GXIMD14793]